MPVSVRQICFRIALLLLGLLPFSGLAQAGDLVVVSSGGTVFVMRGDQLAGQTPLTLPNLPAGAIDLGFRESALGATVFTQRVEVPATGTLQVSVNLPERVATVSSGPPPTATPTPPPPADGGDVYVLSTPAGAQVILDGQDTGMQAPAMLRGIKPGKHTVQVRSECTRAQTDVNVTKGTIARVELTPTSGTGTLTVTGTPAGARLLVDGAEVGKLPATAKDLSCADHELVVRAPGYLEETRTVRVPAFETRTVDINLRKEEFGTLVLDVDPLETLVKVDGIELGTGPRTVEKVATGPHVVEGSLFDYQTQTLNVEVLPEQVSRVEIKLLPLSAVVQPPPPPPAPSKPWGRIALNSGVTVLALGSTALSVTNFMDAREAYDNYQTIESDQAAQAIYDDFVVPNRRQSLIFGAGAVVGLAAAGGLWYTTEF